MTYFVGSQMASKIKPVIEIKAEYIKTRECKICTLNHIYPGLNPGYALIHGTSELKPVIKDPKKIISRTKNS
jgi:hypothetical protein